MAVGKGIAAVLLIVIVAIAGAAYVSTHSSLSNFKLPNLGSPSGSAINSAGDPISVNSIYQQYSQNQAQADTQYTGKVVYLTGTVANVETYKGNYASCVGIQDFGETGCVMMQESAFAGWAIWNWASQSAASQVSINKQFIAKCTVSGYSNGYLTLKGCTIVNSTGTVATTSPVSVSNQAVDCSTFLAPIQLTSVAYVVNPGDGNLSFYVHNSGNTAVVLNRLGVSPYNITIPPQTMKFINLTNLRLGLAGQTLNLAIGFAPPSGFANSQVFGGTCSVPETVTIYNNESSVK